MLSSLTYTGIPSKAYAQDWVYAVGNMMIPVVAFVAVYVALPFYRRLDVTSAYEYLEHRFSRGVRLFGSASFTLFHIFRMAVVMSLTGLALAVATPLTPAQSVLLMGVLSVIYCTMGGVEAVIWTDTIQTFVLLGGALLALVLLIAGADGGLSGSIQAALQADKLRVANFHWDVTSAQIALWVIVIGAIGQNISSYTADQAVVQRYMTTRDEKLAARSIWTNAGLSIFATLLFFSIGTALFTFYRSHPDRLDAAITTDQVFPLFIAQEMPIGIAGLVVAGIFSAAQSTVSTSMNSTATTVVTDFMRPLGACKTEHGYLVSARVITFLVGAVGHAVRSGLCRPTDQVAVRRLHQGDRSVHGRVGGPFHSGRSHSPSQCFWRLGGRSDRSHRDVLALAFHTDQRLSVHRLRYHRLCPQRLPRQPCSRGSRPRPDRADFIYKNPLGRESAYEECLIPTCEAIMSWCHLQRTNRVVLEKMPSLEDTRLCSRVHRSGGIPPSTCTGGSRVASTTAAPWCRCLLQASMKPRNQQVGPKATGMVTAYLIAATWSLRLSMADMKRDRRRVRWPCQSRRLVYCL